MVASGRIRANGDGGAVVERACVLDFHGSKLYCDRVVSTRDNDSAPPGVVYFGGYASDRNADKAEALWRWSLENNRSYLCFDYSGHGESYGKFTEGTLGLWLEEALFAVEQLTSGPQVVVGSSMGGWVALLAALKRPELIGGLVTVACAADFSERVIRPKLSASDLKELDERGYCEENERTDGPPRVVSRIFLEEARDHLLLDADAPIAVRCPVRMIHGLADESIPWETSLDVARRLASNDVSLELVPGADHRLSGPSDIKRMLARVEEVSLSVLR